MHPMVRSIVVGVDESPGAAEALRWAARERQFHQCSLTAVLCWNYLDQHQLERDQPFDPSYDEHAAQQALDAIVARVLGEEASIVERTTVLDHPARGLLEASADADLLVVGARGLGGFREVVVGSVSRQCLHHAKIPVAVVREGGSERPDNGRVVVGVDGSDSSQRALAWALEEGRRRRAPVTVVHAWNPPFVGGVVVADIAYDAPEFERSGDELLDAAMNASDTSGVAVDRQTVRAAAGPAIVDAATDASLVVVGSRGRGGFSGLLLGSVSHHVTHHAPCPVVAIPHA